MSQIIKSIMDSSGFNYIQSIDCEGYIFDKALRENVLNLERFLNLNTEAGIYTLLFITPHFANILYKENLVDKIKKSYKVVFGLHIHSNDFPDEIQFKCTFAKRNYEDKLINMYSLDEQRLMINHSMRYLNDRGIYKIEGFRGGYFGINNDTEIALKEHTDIYFESHNIFRNEYQVTKQLLTPYPVYAFDDKEELRLEYFSIDKLSTMLKDAIKDEKKVIGITHSYLLKDDEIHVKMKALIDLMKKCVVKP